MRTGKMKGTCAPDDFMTPCHTGQGSPGADIFSPKGLTRREVRPMFNDEVN